MQKHAVRGRVEITHLHLYRLNTRIQQRLEIILDVLASTDHICEQRVRTREVQF